MEEIGQASIEVRDWIKGQGTMPVLITVAGQQINRAKYLYLLAKATVQVATHNNAPIVVSPSIENPDVKSTDNVTATKLYKEPKPQQGYISLAWRLLRYMDTKQRAPAYGTTEHGLMGFGNMIETYSRIIAYYKEEGILPAYANIKHILYPDATTPAPETGVYYETSWQDLDQTTNYTCGPTASAMALSSLLGLLPGEFEMANLEGTQPGVGTDHEGIKSGCITEAQDHGVTIRAWDQYFSDLGNTIDERYKKAGELIVNPNIAIIWHIRTGNSPYYVHDYGHYCFVVKIDMNTRKVYVADPARIDVLKYDFETFLACMNAVQGQGSLIVLEKQG
jgi:predicted double-glycine peptidase